MWPPTFTRILLLSLLFCISLASAKKHEKILLSKVQSLTLRKGLKTTHRRVSAVPQLKCIGGGACSYYEIDVLRCQNAGSEYSAEDIQWTCTASLPPEFKLGSTDVICEGYDSSSDPYVLKGSCGVEYRLIPTDVGERKFGKSASDWENREGSVDGSAGPIAKFLFWLLFLGVATWIVRALYLQYRHQVRTPRAPRRPRAPGFRDNSSWGGGGGDDDDDPPPPYDWGSGFRAKPSSSTYGAAPRSGGWTPGFWSGAAGGAAAGYAASRVSGGGRNQGQGGWGWSGGGGGGGGARSGSYAGGSSVGESSGSGSYSSTRYDSSGFGGTSRR
ncbi:MAG: hypothetical protein MMC23_008810 [Stictis urceolatum]|nr:hypothetical protein [Stictis urceolata]